MAVSNAAQSGMSKSRAIPSVLGVSLAMLAFCSLFFSLDQAYYRFIAPRFPNVGDSTWMATAFGVVSRAPWILLIIGAAVVRPRLLALRLGDSLKRWRLILLLLSVNLSLVGGYLLLSGGSTPYSGNQWLLTEVFTVPLVEELFWRGLVFSVLLRLLSGALQLRSRTALAVWLSGTAFGLLHAGNALAGVPLQFVAIQTLSAVLWGVMYGYARSQANSVYPPLLLHGAMNLLVVAF